MPAFAGQLTAAREGAGLSRRDVADQVGVTASLIGKYERGERQPTVATLTSLQQVLGASFDVPAPLRARRAGTGRPGRDSGALRHAVAVVVSVEGQQAFLASEDVTVRTFDFSVLAEMGSDERAGALAAMVRSAADLPEELMAPVLARISAVARRG